MRRILSIICSLTFSASLYSQNIRSNEYHAELTVRKVSNSTTFDNEGKIIGKSTTEQSYSTPQILTFYPGIYTPTASRLSYCSDLNATCNFITGDNAIVTDKSGNKLKSPVQFSSTYSSWELCDNKLKETHKGGASASTTDYLVTSSIGFVKFNAPEEEMTPVPLVKSNDDFVPPPLIKTDYSIRLYVSVGSFFHTITSTDQYRYCMDNQWKNSEPSTFSLPNYSELSSQKKSFSSADQTYISRYIHISDADIKSLIKTSNGSFNLTYYSYSKNSRDGKITDETETKIFVTLTLHK